MEKTINLLEVLDSFTGTDDDGDPKAVIQISLLESGKEKAAKMESFTVLQAFVSHLKVVGSFLSMGIDFEGRENIYFDKTCEVIEKFISKNVDADDLYITVAGIHENFQYHVLLMDPVISMKCQVSEQLKCIQMVFSIDSMSLYENNIDYNEIRAEVAREYEYEEPEYWEETEIIEEQDESEPDIFSMTSIDLEENDKFIRFTKE